MKKFEAVDCVGYSSTRSGSQAARRSALDTLADPEFRHAAYAPLSFAAFAAACKRLPTQAEAILVTSVEIYKMTWSTVPILQAAMGFLGHQYVVVTVLLPDGRSTYIKADCLVEDHPCAASRLILTFNDDRGALTTDSYLLARISAAAETSGKNPETDRPALAALASLFAVADARLGTRPYRVLGRNCFWLADTLFYALARRYPAYWLAGTLTPDAPLRRYLRGTAGALETALACMLPTAGGWARCGAWWAAYAVRGVLVLGTWNKTGVDRWVNHDEEVAEWMREWREREGGEKDTDSAG